MIAVFLAIFIVSIARSDCMLRRGPVSDNIECKITQASDLGVQNLRVCLSGFSVGSRPLYSVLVSFDEPNRLNRNPMLYPYQLWPYYNATSLYEANGPIRTNSTNMAKHFVLPRLEPQREYMLKVSASQKNIARGAFADFLRFKVSQNGDEFQLEQDDISKSFAKIVGATATFTNEGRTKDLFVYINPLSKHYATAYGIENLEILLSRTDLEGQKARQGTLGLNSTLYRFSNLSPSSEYEVIIRPTYKNGAHASTEYMSHRIYVDLGQC